ncbi:hypothetical protein RJ639_001307 [Escallonia herrerae]|uniref:Cupin type-1 domain-containing protein n=1 Tax=Escallonia herrerae TaxID=1293975 RepID=A0AA88X8X5_9ASTE|nr:hypothetical protein RJ639_001307 [Escallonia herrerae]
MILKPKLSLLALFGVSLVLGLVSVSRCHQNDDQAEQELHRCQLRCVRPLQPFRRQAVCQDQCVQQYREQKGRERERGGSDDPRRELERCQRQCQEQESGQRQQHQCQIRCQEEYKEQRKEQEQREECERGNPQAEDPQRRYEQCQEECRRQEQGGRHQQQCQKRCQEQYEEQSREQEEREQRERGRRTGNPQVEDPRQRFEQCQEQCRRQRPGHMQQEQCQRRCQEDYDEQRREEEEREQRERGQGSGNPEVEDPRQRYEQCQQQCRRQERGQRQQQEWCQRRCQEEYEEQQREQEEREKHGGGGRDHHEPEQVYRQCQQRCERQPQREQRQCQERCERQYKEQKQEQREKGGEHGEDVNPQREEQEENNPYFFRAQSSNLDSGPKKAMLGFLRSSLRGNGTINLVQQNRRESFNMQRGDSIRVPSGTTVYLINRDNNEKLHAVKLLKPVNNPGQFEPYFGAGGEDPESFYRAFSNEILESALNTPRDRLDRLFGQQRRGVIVRASQEQIKALSQHASSSRGRGESRGPFNLFNERPIYSNKFGQFFEASPNDHEQLKDLDVSVAFMSINQGGMIAPYYNTKSTRLVLVVEGSGRFEMACPELASQSQGSQGRREQETGERGAHYQKVGGRLFVGDAFVIPAGHPIAIVASQNENLQLVGFGINAQNNQKNFLAGKGNIWNQVQREAKELSFRLPAREVEDIFRKQEQAHFVLGPEQRQESEEGRGRVVASILGFIDLF